VTHLHNGHTAAESDGNPFQTRGEGHDGYDSWYIGGNGQWYYDNLYLNMPAGNDPREMQSFMWFHDHRMDNTGSNVYKGMVGLYPIYDPILDPGDETQGLRLPGVPQGDGRVAYDIPIALYDCAFDDGVTPHLGMNVGSSLEFGTLQNGLAHPENWGRLFFAHYENQGFVGDVFTVNGIAYPYLPVKRRKYRLRFLDCSIARQYDLKLMKGTPRLKPGLQGQYELTSSRQCMRFVQIATEGGLMPRPIVRDSIGLWPAKRREVIVDFSKYMDGSPTKNGDVIYLTNNLSMKTGRKADGLLSSGVPLMQFIIDGNPPQPDLSVIPATLRERPPVPSAGQLAGLMHRTFEHPLRVRGSVDDCQRRRRLDAPFAHPPGRARGAFPQRPDTSSERQRQGGRGRLGGERVRANLPQVPHLPRTLRVPLSQPGPRRPRHDVRLADRVRKRVGDFRSLGDFGSLHPLFRRGFIFRDGLEVCRGVR
jgi:hypothetical protein